MEFRNKISRSLAIKDIGVLRQQINSVQSKILLSNRDIIRRALSATNAPGPQLI